MKEEFKRLSNESRQSPRWHAVCWYRSDTGLIDVGHDFMELSELDALIEIGPDWRTLEKVELFYRNEGERLVLSAADQTGPTGPSEKE